MYRAFNAPKMRELYRNSHPGNTIILGNPFLEPETLVGGEIGYDRVLPRGRLMINLYRNEIEGIIIRGPVEGQPDNVIQYANLGDARSQGVELMVEHALSRRWGATLGYTWADSTMISVPADPSLEGNQIPEVVPHIGTLGLRYRGDGGLAANARLRVLSKSYGEPVNLRAAPAHEVLDLSASYPVTSWMDAYVEATNVFDERVLFRALRADRPRGGAKECRRRSAGPARGHLPGGLALSLARHGLLLALAAVWVFGCSGPESPAPAAQSGPRLETVRMSLLPTMTWAPAMIAEAEGYFEEEGVEIEFVRIDANSSLLALASGSVDVVGNPIRSGLFNLILRDVPFQIVADSGHFDSGPCASHGFTAPPALAARVREEGLRGQRVATIKGGITEYMVNQLLASQGLTVDDVELVEYPPGESMTGEFRVMEAVRFNLEPNLTVQKQQGLIEMVFSANEVAPGFQKNVLGYGDRLIHENPELRNEIHEGMVAWRPSIQRRQDRAECRDHQPVYGASARADSSGLLALHRKRRPDRPRGGPAIAGLDERAGLPRGRHCGLAVVESALYRGSESGSVGSQGETELAPMARTT